VRKQQLSGNDTNKEPTSSSYIGDDTNEESTSSSNVGNDTNEEPTSNSNSEGVAIPQPRVAGEDRYPG
jgi:hypothetical protein